jgi:hypothetical protein
LLNQTREEEKKKKEVSICSYLQSICKWLLTIIKNEEFKTFLTKALVNSENFTKTGKKIASHLTAKQVQNLKIPEVNPQEHIVIEDNSQDSCLEVTPANTPARSSPVFSKEKLEKRERKRKFRQETLFSWEWEYLAKKHLDEARFCEQQSHEARKKETEVIQQVQKKPTLYRTGSLPDGLKRSG